MHTNFSHRGTKITEKGKKIIPAGANPSLRWAGSFKKVAKHAFWDESNVRCRDASTGTTHPAPTLRALCASVRDQLFDCGFVVLYSSCSSGLNMG